MNQEEREFYEKNAIIKYEKGSKSYRPKFRENIRPVVCQKCGSPYNLIKTNIDGEDYWFCKPCIMQRAKQIKNQKEVIIPEREF